VDGLVFHLSLLSNLPAILSSGAIEPNSDDTSASTFGHSQKSYFRKRECVSVFDLRAPRPDDFDWRCWPFPWTGTGLAIFILSPDACAGLLPWTG
jgi:hypothetical protein